MISQDIQLKIDQVCYQLIKKNQNPKVKSLESVLIYTIINIPLRTVLLSLLLQTR